MRSERDRGEIFEALCRGIGVPAAEFVMQLFDTVDRLLLAQERDTAVLRGEMVDVRGEMAEVRGEMAEVRGEMRALAADLRGEMAELRGEMRAMLPRFVMTTLAMMIALVAAVITAGQLL